MSNIIISREEAHAKGLKHFYTGKPCKYGHDSHRFVTTSGCVKCGIVRSRKFASDQKAKQGKFIYPLKNWQDHEKAWAYCQALDIASGHIPTAKPSAPELMFEEDSKICRDESGGIDIAAERHRRLGISPPAWPMPQMEYK